jgi:hypothetical protein
MSRRNVTVKKKGALFFIVVEKRSRFLYYRFAKGV